jgi:8-oxo-dGTP pyrophosphatase MutT (NUDIX family)
MANDIKTSELHRIVITAIVYRESESGFEYLITKRSSSKKAFPNKWTVPGGGLEPEDYTDLPKTIGDAWYFVLEKALRREVLEEVNVEIEKPNYLLDLVFIRPDNIPVLTLSYYAKYKSGKVKLEEEEATEFKWISANEVRDFDFISGIDPEIELVDKILRKEKDQQFKV